MGRGGYMCGDGGLVGGEGVFNVRLYWIPLVQVRGRGGEGEREGWWV